MAQITLDKKEWLNHLGQFDINMNDLTINIMEKPTCIGYSTAYQTHFLKVFYQYPDAPAKAGALNISDLSKTCAFINKCAGLVTIKQVKGGKTLYVTSGNMKMNIPVTDMKSSQLVPTFEKLVVNAEKANWKSFGQDTFTFEGKTQMTDILKLATLKSIVNKDSDYKMTADADSSELTISVGKAHDVKLFATSNMRDTEGPKHSVSSSFGPWLLPCLGLVNHKMVSKIHFGDSTGLVVIQSDNMVKRLLIIIDQQE
tara:strand:- start:636 stop:1403 length:768 start_codon:yes stop_codon:yes gene_type:complete